MLMEHQAELLKLEQVEKQMENLNKKNQTLQVENLCQAVQNEMECFIKMFHQDSSSSQNIKPSIDLDFCFDFSSLWRSTWSGIC